jgi:hypothetical protein
MAIALFSKEYFKQHFFAELVSLSCDVVANVRLKLCTMMPRLKSLLSLPSDKALLQLLEATVKDLLLRETDADVLFALQTAIQDLDGTETGVDGVPSMNVEEDRDNERKLREERLIASMEEQLYKIHSVQSSPSKKISHVPVPASSASPRLRMMTGNDLHAMAASEGIKRRSESVPATMTRPSPPDLSSLARQTPEPSRTYSPELSVLKNDKSFLDYPKVDTSNWDALVEQQNKSTDKQSKHHMQPYSSSLENLDPSAKEFLVDAGVLLDNTSHVLTTAASMPNLSKLAASGKELAENIRSAASVSNLEGEFAKYLISNAEMEQYEQEYQRCASFIASGSIEQLAPQQQQQQQSSPGGIKSPLIVSVNNTPEQHQQLPPSNIPTIPSTPPIGIARQSRLGSPSKYATSFQRPGPTTNNPQSPSSMGTNVSSFAQSTLSKLTSGSDIQGSIERLAEKWEAKRKSLIAVASGSFDYEEPQESPMEIAKQNRATIMEQKLQAIKQQGIPKKRSLLKPPAKSPGMQAATAQKRLSLTDQVEAVGQKAVHKFILGPANQRRKSMEMMISYSDSGEERTSEDSSSDDQVNGMDDPKMSHKLREVRHNRGGQPESLPPYPTNARYLANGHPGEPLPPPPSSMAEAMSTYVPPSSTHHLVFSSTHHSMSSAQLVVKPINTNPMMSYPAQRNMTRLPTPPVRSLPQPPRSLPMPPTYRQAPTGPTMSLLRAPTTSMVGNRSVYSVNKPNNQRSQQQQPSSLPTMGSNRQLPQPNQRPNNVGNLYFQPVAVLPQPPSPHKSPMYDKPPNGGKGSKSKPVSPYIVSVNSPPESTSPEHSPSSGGPNTNSISSASSSSQSSIESPSGLNSGHKYTRVPPPRYRPHQPPLAQRRPLSGGPYQQSSQQNSQPRDDGSNNRMNHSEDTGRSQQQHASSSSLKQNRYGKSVSAESVLVTEQQQRIGYNNGYNRAGTKTSSGGSSSRSSSPHSSNSESQLTPPDDSPENSRQQDQHYSRPNNRMGGIPQGPMRRSSGMRMWQGQMNHQPRSTNNQRQPPPSPAPSGGMRKQPVSRSPSPGRSRNQQPRSNQSLPSNGSRLRMPSGGGGGGGGGGGSYPQQQQGYHRGSSLPGAYQQMNSYSGTGSNQSSPHQHSNMSKQSSRRPSSLHSSPGSSRPSSPQMLPEQRRRSSHYPASTNIGKGPMGGGPPPPYGARQPQQQQQQSSRGIPQQTSPQNPDGSSTSSVQRNSLSTQHYSNNAKRQLQQPQYGGGQYNNSAKQSVGLPAPGFSSRLPMGSSQRSN